MFNLQIIAGGGGSDKTKAERKRSIDRSNTIDGEQSAERGFYYMIYVKSAQTFAGVPIKHPSTAIHTEEKWEFSCFETLVLNHRKVRLKAKEHRIQVRIFNFENKTAISTFHPCINP